MKTGLGIAFIPGTFPTGVMLDAVQAALPATAVDWDRGKINDLYFAYKDGVNAGEPIVRPGEFGVKNYMMEQTNFTESDIRVFLMVLYTLAESGRIDQQYWNIPLQEKSILTKVTALPEQYIKTADKMAGAIKWGSILALGGIGLYFAWPLIKKIKRRS